MRVFRLQTVIQLAGHNQRYKSDTDEMQEDYSDDEDKEVYTIKYDDASDEIYFTEQ